MRLFDVVPVSWSTVLILSVALAVIAVGWRPVVRRTGWSARPTLVSAVGLAVVLALTLGGGTEPDHIHGGAAACSAEESVAETLLEPTHNLESALNLALLVPVGAASALAVRRPFPPLLLVLVLPAAVEAVQLTVPGRICSPADYLLNALGGVVGVGTGVAALARQRGRADREEVAK